MTTESIDMLLTKQSISYDLFTTKLKQSSLTDTIQLDLLYYEMHVRFKIKKKNSRRIPVLIPAKAIS